ncbi:MULTISPECIES: PadR family transcriptional regulator [Gordonia]|uniref:Putative PadR family transcriptional regulator n=1 Tax=Gordonia sputi NBRC 100414 TaxID=1089453 RepID=H5U0C6_9ACTN|nr:MULTISPECIES: PadR family transcriptional regulator [Gordonia]NKY95336.1 PadR family transcriptional regulator [Gordonia sputi]OBA38872.1 PadR family transcriptional regulator [Gordonia sp. 852002-51296_SCH5728562-b]OBC09734.1 PadR family transcriptional regulator [Gordonia sp. 852002-50395_SCH5434458]OBC11828.1 PadR family transcriptional regulator [Gordonia sp. 852002-50816_SCH5313054-a]OBC21622.1 PadR family transcriptional regulator [Gordonia sp. 852002-50816_SCH5313054-c]
MTVTRPLAPQAILVLGLVAERPMHPYEMFQTTIEREEDRLTKIRPGTLYHTVDRLAADGLIEVVEVRQEGNRPQRTVYAITEAGRAALAASLEAILERHPVEYPELYLALSEAHSLPRQRVVELLERRIDAMRADRERVEVAAEAAHARGAVEMFYLDVGCRLATLQTQIDWLVDLVGRLRHNDIEWIDDPGSTWRTKHTTTPSPPQSSPAQNSSPAQDSSTPQKVQNS